MYVIFKERVAWYTWYGWCFRVRSGGGSSFFALEPQPPIVPGQRRVAVAAVAVAFVGAAVIIVVVVIVVIASNVFKFHARQDAQRVGEHPRERKLPRGFGGLLVRLGTVAVAAAGRFAVGDDGAARRAGAGARRLRSVAGNQQQHNIMRRRPTQTQLGGGCVCVYLV